MDRYAAVSAMIALACDYAMRFEARSRAGTMTAVIERRLYCFVGARLAVKEIIKQTGSRSRKQIEEALDSQFEHRERGTKEHSE